MEQPALNYRQLGHKTLVMLILKRLGAFVVFTFIFIGMLAAPSFIPAAAPVLITILPFAAAFCLLVLLATLIVAGLEYWHYTIVVDEENFKLSRGIITEEQIGVPCWRIRQVVIERGVVDELFGTSTVMLTVAGDESGGAPHEESKILLPMLDKTVAEQIQNALLKRAGVDGGEVNPAEARLES